jgi:hypothetical protein
VFGFGGLELNRFERQAAAEIRGRLEGESARVAVEVDLHGWWGGLTGDVGRATILASEFSTPGIPLFVEPERSRRGRLRELRLDLRDFTLAGLRIEALEARIPDCRYDLGLAQRQRKFRLSRSGEGTGWVRVREADLAAFVLRKFPEIKQVQITLKGGHVLVDGLGEFLIFQTRFFAVARLEPVDGRRLILAEAKIYLDGWRPADEEARRALLGVLNPVVDLDKDLGLAGAIDLERIEIRDGVLIGWGRTRIPTRPAAPATSR